MSLVIEDLMVHLAESVSRIYVDLTVEAEDLIPWPPLTKLKYSSTRAIIAFRNKLFMNHWVLFNYESVLAMYADKYNLWTLKKNAGRKSMRKSSLKVRENYWVMGKNERQIDASNSAEENCLLIKRCLPIRRASDLQQLEKWFVLTISFFFFCEVFLKANLPEFVFSGGCSLACTWNFLIFLGPFQKVLERKLANWSPSFSPH